MSYNPFDDIQPPKISEDLIQKCKETDDYREILFEYYKFVGKLVVVCSCLLYESPAWGGRKRKLWEVCASSFSRIRGLMSANLEFFQDDRYIEASQIIDRCIFETAAKISWMAQDPTDERLQRYLEGSIRPDREHKAIIEANITDRGNAALVIEERMLLRMERFERLAGMAEVPTKELRRMPDLSVILKEIGHGRGVYIAVGKVGSHAVHGNWQHLLSQCLTEKNGILSVKQRSAISDPAQYALISIFVLEACDTYVSNCFTDQNFSIAFSALVRDTQEEIMKWNNISLGNDFEVISPKKK
jgi:hypothetical protein